MDLCLQVTLVHGRAVGTATPKQLPVSRGGAHCPTRSALSVQQGAVRRPHRFGFRPGTRSEHRVGQGGGVGGLGRGLFRTPGPAVCARTCATRLGRTIRGCPVTRAAGLLTAPVPRGGTRGRGMPPCLCVGPGVCAARVGGAPCGMFGPHGCCCVPVEAAAVVRVWGGGGSPGQWCLVGVRGGGGASTVLCCLVLQAPVGGATGPGLHRGREAEEGFQERLQRRLLAVGEWVQWPCGCADCQLPRCGGVFHRNQFSPMAVL